MLYESYVLWHGLLAKFPKTERYALGQTCNQFLLDVLERVISSATTTDVAKKKEYLRQGSVKLDLLKLLIRLAKDCQCLSHNHYLVMESKLHQAGKMLGGWIKSFD